MTKIEGSVDHWQQALIKTMDMIGGSCHFQMTKHRGTIYYKATTSVITSPFLNSREIRLWIQTVLEVLEAVY